MSWPLPAALPSAAGYAAIVVPRLRQTRKTTLNPCVAALSDDEIGDERPFGLAGLGCDGETQAMVERFE